MVLKHALWEDVMTWGCFEYGIVLGMDSKDVLTHIIWADNIYFLAATAHQLQTMVNMATCSVHKFGMRWKPSSLQLLAGGAPMKTKPRLSASA